MERLTSYKNDCKREMICRYEDCDTCEEYCPHLSEDNCPCLQEVLEKLAEYENLEEQGRLLKLPCAVGDTVYVLCIDNSSYMISNKKVWEIVEERFEIRHFDCIGKTVFLTRQEAEDKRVEMEGKK